MRSTRLLVLPLLLLPSLTLAAPATADQTPAATEDGYTSWLVAVDAAAVGFTALAIAAENQSLATASLFPLFLAAPGVHLLHGNPGRATTSVALRLGTPILGGFVAGAIAAAIVDEPGGEPPHGHRFTEGDDPAWTIFGAAALGALGGYAVAMIVDWTVLGRPLAPPAKKAARLAPTLALSPHGTTLGLAGRF